MAQIPRYLASKLRTDRQTDTKTDNKGRLKLAAHEPIIMTITMGGHLIHPANFFIGVQI